MNTGSPNPLRNPWLLFGLGVAILVLTLALTRTPGPGSRESAPEAPQPGAEGPRIVRQSVAGRPASIPGLPPRPAPPRRTPLPGAEETTSGADSSDPPPPQENFPHPYLSPDLLALDDSYDPEIVFGEAAEEFQVPADLLKAVAYVESGGNHRHGVRAQEGGFGVMRLREEEGGSNTLEEAARLLGVEKAVLVRDPVQNIRGAAALIRSNYEEAERAGGSEAAPPWLTAITLYSGRTPEQALRYGREIERILREGLTHTTDGGQMLYISPQQDHLLTGAPAPTPAAPVITPFAG